MYDRPVRPRAPSETVADRYRIIRLLGRGGFATTYEAEDLGSGQRVALKELRLAGVDHWQAVQLFEREARVLRAIDHPRVPAYLDFLAPDEGGGGAAGFDFVLVQTLAPGRTLERLCAAGWRPGEAELIGVIRQILETLDDLHRMAPPVIHRDIKPGNIVRTDDGKVMLVDFGAVRDRLASQTTTAGSFVGTPGYMAPEQLQGQAAPASDLYGLAATAVRLLTGRHPSELPHRRLKLDFRAASAPSPGLAAWLDRALEPAPEDRFPSARAALAALAAPSRTRSSSTWAPARASGSGRLRVLRDEPDALELDVGEAPPGPGTRRADAAVAALVGATTLTVTGLLSRTSRPALLILVALAATALSGAIGLPYLRGRLGRTRLRLDGAEWQVQRRLLGVPWRRARGPIAEVTGLDSAVSLSGGRVGVALRTRRRGHLLLSRPDDATRERLEALVAGWLARRG